MSLVWKKWCHEFSQRLIVSVKPEIIIDRDVSQLILTFHNWSFFLLTQNWSSELPNFAEQSNDASGPTVWSSMIHSWPMLINLDQAWSTIIAEMCFQCMTLFLRKGLRGSTADMRAWRGLTAGRMRGGWLLYAEGGGSHFMTLFLRKSLFLIYFSPTISPRLVDNYKNVLQEWHVKAFEAILGHVSDFLVNDRN